MKRVRNPFFKFLIGWLCLLLYVLVSSQGKFLTLYYNLLHLQFGDTSIIFMFHFLYLTFSFD